MRFICVWIIAPLFILISVLQIVGEGREDFPFSKWGMYSDLKKTGPAGKTVLNLHSQGSSINAMKYVSSHYTLQRVMRRKFRKLFPKKKGGNAQNSEAIEKSRKFIKDLVETHIIDDIRKHHGPQDKKARLVVEWLEWDHLSRKNLFNPDRRILLYDEKLYPH